MSTRIISSKFGKTIIFGQVSSLSEGPWRGNIRGDKPQVSFMFPGQVSPRFRSDGRQHQAETMNISTDSRG